MDEEVEVRIGADFGSSYADCALTDRIFFRIIENTEKLTSEFCTESSISNMRPYERNFALSCCADLIVDLVRITESITGVRPPSSLSIYTERYSSIVSLGNSIVSWAAILLTRYKDYICKKCDPLTYYSNLSEGADSLIDLVCLAVVRLGETDLTPYIQSCVAERKFKDL